MSGIKWHEQVSLKNLLKAELSILKRGLNGDFDLLDLQVPNQGSGRVTAIGRLKFDRDKVEFIEIIFPTKYPASAPKVMPILVNQSSNNEFVKLDGKHFNKGNQYNDKSMCLFRKDAWDSSIHNIGSILRKAQEWLKFANSEKGFPKNKIIEELPAPLPHAGQVVLPRNEIISANQRTGEFLLKQFKKNHFILESNISPNSTFSIHLPSEIFEWYAFEKGISLKQIISPNNPLGLFEVLKSTFGKTPLDLNANKNFALYIPDEPNPWHFFKVIIQNNGGIQIAYFISRSLEDNLFLRTKDIFDDLILKEKKVTIIGLGALGSEVARSLARNGIGHFNLFDEDTFELGNLVRHAADLFYIGESKVEVARQLISRSNPNITINPYHVDVLNDSGILDQSLLESDLCIVLTGEENVDYMINDYYLPKLNIPYIFARVSAGGVSGSVQVVEFQKTPCLRCLAKKSVDILPKPKKPVSFKELPPEFGSCSTPAVAGSEVDTKEIALQVSRIALQKLLENLSNNYPAAIGNQFYWHGPYGSETKNPFEWEVKNLRKYKDCKICGSQK